MSHVTGCTHAITSIVIMGPSILCRCFGSFTMCGLFLDCSPSALLLTLPTLVSTPDMMLPYELPWLLPPPP